MSALTKRLILLVTIGLPLISSNLDAQISFEFTSTASGGTRVIGTGSGNATWRRKTDTWDIIDFNSNFIASSSGSPQELFANSVTGTLSNLSSGDSVSVIGFSTTHTEWTTDDISWLTSSVIKFKKDDAYSFTMEAIYNVDNLSFTDLVLGSYTDGTSGSGDEIFMTTSISVISVVPEPPSMTFCVVTCMGILLLRKRRRKLAQVA